MADDPYLRHTIIDDCYNVSVCDSSHRNVRDYTNLIKYLVSVHLNARCKVLRP